MNQFKKICFLMMLVFVSNNLFSSFFEEEKMFYQKNKWALIENKLLDKSEVKKLGALSSIYRFGIISAATLGFAFVGLLLIVETLDLTPYKKNAVTLFWIGAILGGLCGKKLAQDFSANFFRNSMDFYALKKFLRNYDPDLQNSDSHNYKLYIPEELYDVFDTLYENYIKHGNLYLKNVGLDILRMMRSSRKISMQH